MVPGPTRLPRPWIAATCPPWRVCTPGEIEMYPTVHHGFAFPQRWCYDKTGAERHWERLIALYRRRLG